MSTANPNNVALGGTANPNNAAPDSTNSRGLNQWLIFACGVLICILCLAAPVAGIFLYLYEILSPWDCFLQSLLFFAPPVLQVLGIWVLSKRLKDDDAVLGFYLFHTTWMVFCLIGCLLAWGFYSIPHNTSSNVYSVYCTITLLFILFLTIPIAGMTYTIMESTGDAERTAAKVGKIRSLILLDGMKQSVSTAPYWCLLFFFSIFLSVTYLFSFEFAFEDRRHLSTSGLPALYMPRPYDMGKPESEHVSDLSHKGSDIPSGMGDVSVYRFYFPEEKAGLEFEEQTPAANGNDKPKDGNKGLSEESKKKNTQSLKNLVQAVKNKTENGGRVRVKLEGKSARRPPTSGVYVSNRELAKARTYNVTDNVLEGLKDGLQRNIEWNRIAMPIEPPIKMATQSYVKTQGKKLDEALEQEKRLKSGQVHEELKSLLGNVKGKIGRNRVSEKELQNLVRQTKDMLNSLGTDIEEKKLNETRLAQEMTEIRRESNQDGRNGNREQRAISLEENKARTTIRRFVEETEQFDLSFEGRNSMVKVTLHEMREEPLFYKFGLMDYVLYTMSGGGYGGVVLLTRYAKVLFLLVQLYRVFTLVALFSAVFSLKKTRKSDSNQAVGDQTKISEESSDKESSSQKKVAGEAPAPPENVSEPHDLTSDDGKKESQSFSSVKPFSIGYTDN